MPNLPLPIIIVYRLTQAKPAAGNIFQAPWLACCKNIATNIVQKIRKEKILICKPSNKKIPPTASLKAPIHAKKIGNILKMPPYSATSLGNQKTTSKKPRLLSVGLQGRPNLAAPKFDVNR